MRPEGNKSAECISLYVGNPITSQTEKKGVDILAEAFPTLKAGFFEVLHEMLIDERFTEARFMDAVKNVIKTCVYPTPTIASILNWDKSLRLYDYQELLDLRQTDENTWSRFFQLKIEGKFYYALKKEADQLGIAYPKDND